MPAKKESEKPGASEKPVVIEYLYSQCELGAIPNNLVTSDQVAHAIIATGAKLGTANPANFLKDIVRSEHANAIWPLSLKERRISARQRYGSMRVFQFINYSPDQTEPFPDRFPVDESTKTHEIQSASLPFAARQLGRKEETWLTQIVVNLRLIESHLSIFSPLRERVRDVTHLQMGMKTQPEIDAVFLASYGQTRKLTSPTNLNLLITCEAKVINQRILEDQIREQIAIALKKTKKIQTPCIDAVKPIAIKVVEFDFDGKKEKAIYIVEFAQVDRNIFESNWSRSDTDEERLYSMPLDAVSKTVYRIMPPIGGLNAG